MRLHYSEANRIRKSGLMTIDSVKISTTESIKAAEEAVRRQRRMYVLYTRYCCSFRQEKLMFSSLPKEDVIDA